ncbi:subclass B3 metallo-beta-lactamase [Parvularcula sp. ZS-1/3]|uniref:Subclass B3 metallo-beta-lactamase n=1 Tax=Parvularcula mediterranea TaxID=2732508 RepID=A0A7Y3W5G1_9PROT|nr:subclass B3 metallo-beta-lactamase [Parvularcula mediterranea]NNU16584.1 subclass B3 metallo-beta-lactamase [Parvularcula mediterranea]
MRNVLSVSLLALAACAAEPDIPSAEQWAEVCEPWDEWDKPGPPFRIHGDTYYVGTCGIAAILVTGEQGHILIDGGSRGGGPLIEANIEALGFRVRDVDFLLHTHEHFDHVGGLAYLQRQSRGKLLASMDAAPVLESGITASNDPQAGMHDPFEPAQVSGLITGEGNVTTGHLTLTAIATPGHTPGALSWQWQSCEGEDCLTIVLMDSLSPVSADDYRFSDHPEYLAAYREGLSRLMDIPCDIALTPHPAGSRMFERIEENTLVGLDECRAYAAKQLQRLDKRLAEEAG